MNIKSLLETLLDMHWDLAAALAAGNDLSMKGALVTARSILDAVRDMPALLWEVPETLSGAVSTIMFFSRPVAAHLPVPFRDIFVGTLYEVTMELLEEMGDVAHPPTRREDMN
jgi:hypothetical protein